MKSWFASSLLWAGVANAGTPADGMACLNRFDIGCAQAAATGMPASPASTRFHASLAFHLGRFDEAATLLESVEGAYADQEDYRVQLSHYRATAEATRGFVTEKRGDVEVRYLPGTDLVLLDDTFEVLQGAHDRIGPRLGGNPPGGIRVELYPTADRFIAASGIGADAVRTTGVVALSKWTRLLVTSPRALGRGYAWKDTLAHEYIHYIVAYRTRDHAPVWLQEGIARSHEALWRSDTFAPLVPYQQSLLAEALAKDEFVTLEEMHPSMAYLPSAEAAALAFAEVSTMMMHLHELAGDRAVARALDEVRDGTDSLTAVAEVAGVDHPDTFMESWKQYIRGLRLAGRKLEAMPTVLGPADDGFAIDPVLAKRTDLARHARVGDLLREKALYAAALVEYRRAIPEDEPPSPLLAARLARTLAALGRRDEALATLRSSIGDYPEFAMTRKDLADLYLAKGDTRSALAEYRAAADVNPFDPEVQAALAQLYAAGGDAARAERHRRYREILQLGGLPPSGVTR